MTIRFSCVALVILLVGCSGTDSDINNPPSNGAAIGTDSDVDNPRSDGAVNGFILTDERGFRDYGENRTDWVKTSHYEEYDGNYAGSLSTCDINYKDQCSTTTSYYFDENGRVRSTSSSGWWGISTLYFEVQEDFVAIRKGTPADLVYRHNEYGIVESMNFENDRAEASFIHNAAGQIVNATFKGMDGEETYYTHFYNDVGQRFRTEKIATAATAPPNHLVSHYEYQYDEDGNNILEVEYLPTGEIFGQKTFEYTPSDRRTVNLRLRELIYFGFWPW